MRFPLAAATVGWSVQELATNAGILDYGGLIQIFLAGAGYRSA